MIKRGKTVPVILGGDLNAYSVALAFYEEYGVISHAFMRYKCGATAGSKFIKIHLCSGLDDVKIAIPELLKFAAEHSRADLYLIPSADWYVTMLEESGGVLSGIYRIHIPDCSLQRSLSDKAEFYSMLKKRAILHPRFVTFSRSERISKNKLYSVRYPAVLKPSDSTEYWRNAFSGMKKVYFPKSSTEAESIIKRIFLSGYNKSIILQEKVGDSRGDRVLTTFSDSRGSVVRAVYGDVILEERGRTSIGNHSAIITLPLDRICFELIDFLNSVSYKGFANFDIVADGNLKYVLEVNTRQGRSCDYMRAAGVNIAKLLVTNFEKGRVAPDFRYKEIYWHYPSHKDVMRYSDTESARLTAERLYKEGFSFSPYNNGYEGLRRQLYVLVHNRRLSASIKKNLIEKQR